MRCLFVFLIIYIAVPVYARIGETEKQCMKRYGKPISIKSGKITGSKVNIYKKYEYQIIISFYKNKAYMIEYTKCKGNDNFTDLEIYKFLKANGIDQLYSTRKQEKNMVEWKYKNIIAHVYKKASEGIMILDIKSEYLLKERTIQSKKLDEF